jgi:hypothetical protein
VGGVQQNRPDAESARQADWVILHHAEKQSFLNPHDFNLQCMKFVSNKLKSMNVRATFLNMYL